MKRKNFKKKKMTSKQANMISLFISTAYFIFMVIIGMFCDITTENYKDKAIYYWLLICIIGTLFLYILFYFLIFRGDELKVQEENKLNIETEEKLSFVYLTQVYFFQNEIDDIIHHIIEKEEIKFFAKLTESYNIRLIAIDRYGDEVYNKEIRDLIYFESNFKFEK